MGFDRRGKRRYSTGAVELLLQNPQTKCISAYSSWEHDIFTTTHSTNSTALLAVSRITGSKLPPALLTLKSWDILYMEEKTERCGTYHKGETKSLIWGMKQTLRADIWCRKNYLSYTTFRVRICKLSLPSYRRTFQQM